MYVGLAFKVNNWLAFASLQAMCEINKNLNECVNVLWRNFRFPEEKKKPETLVKSYFLQTLFCMHKAGVNKMKCKCRFLQM